jgi:hypothetical protein
LLAAELAAGKTVREAAGRAGISERTAHRRLEDSTFRARIAALRAEMLSAASGRLADGMVAAADVLRKLLAHRDANIRRQTAAKLLELGLRVREVVELEQRVQDLEAKLSEPT